MNIKKIKETCLYTESLDEIKDFYTRIMQFQLISHVKDRHVFFRVGEDVLLFFNPNSTKHEKTLPAHFAKGPQHIAFEVSRQEYESSKEKLSRAGVVISHTQDWKGGKLESFYFGDPAGNILEIVPEGLWD
jgi:catechol 2,3-dioxygenase-like lactoylglutathione lyase family enzyme